MAWLKNVVVDILVTVVIILVTNNVLPEWADWIVVVYTPFMLVLKAITLFGGVKPIKSKNAEENPPDWFLHVLYAINIAALAYAGWYITAGQWGLIWLFSFIIDKRS